MTDRDSGAWFAPKRYGYGTGLPIAWQGWVLLAGYLVFMVLFASAAHQHPLIVVPLLIAATIGFAVVAARRTRGGWRWRWGE